VQCVSQKAFVEGKKRTQAALDPRVHMNFYYFFMHHFSNEFFAIFYELFLAEIFGDRV
jgi:hypothetical protein